MEKLIEPAGETETDGQEKAAGDGARSAAAEEDEEPLQYKAVNALLAHGDTNSPEFLAALDAMVPPEILPLKQYFEQY